MTHVYYEATPNPQSMKFIVDHPVADETLSVTKVEEAGRSPLAQKLFGFPWMAGVLLGPHFVTITKQDWVDWSIIADPLCSLLAEHFDSGDVTVLPPDSMEESSDDTEEVLLIKKVLNEEIRPAVAMDGGDIAFRRYDNNVLYVELKGSCSGCPSSTATLKDGIEVRLKERLPSLREVVAVN
jgi:Fe-S cluster biogenesis protein NfuA